MEFWGAEVKSGQNCQVEVEDDGSRILHLSQVALGEVTGDNKKDKGESVCVYVKINDKKYVIGTLSHDKFPQLPLDLVVHGKFELSHNWKNGSVYFTGYYVDTAQAHDSESDEELPEQTINLVKPQVTEAEPTTSKQVKIVEPKKDEDSSDEDDEDDTSTEDEESSDDQQPGMLANGENESDDDDDAESDEDDSDEESSEEDEETPQKVETSKKRPAESATKTPAQEKKAKLVTPQKTDGKKVGGHTATPYPSKQAGKASTAAGQVKQNQKSGGSSSISCKSCGRTFGSENALQSHSKAKHGAAAV